MGLKWTLNDGIEERMRRKTRPCACAARHALSHLSHTRPPGREPRHLPTSLLGGATARRLKTRSVPAFRHRRDRPGQHSDNIGTA